MKNMKTALLAGAAILAFASVAHAEVTDYRGLYLGGFGGLNIQNGEETTPYSTVTNAPVGATGEIEYDTGYTVGGELGYSWGNGFQTGLEYAYRNVNVDNIDVGAGSAFITKDGEVTLHTVMANATYQLPVEFFGFIRPYAGAGIGVGFVDFKNYNVGGFTVDDDDTLLAYQGFGGLAFNLTSRLQATAEYRYVATDKAKLDTDTTNVRSDLDFSAHNFLAGLRYQFGEPVTKAAAPAPAPMPAPMAAAPAPRPAAPAPVVPPVAQTYIVFFDFDKADLTPEAHRVIERAAQDVRVGKGARIQVVGHTDRSGSNKYNQRLSERRASVVKTELVRLGVTTDQIAARGVGETEPRVATADGVREAQNRRAEIIFQ